LVAIKVSQLEGEAEVVIQRPSLGERLDLRVRLTLSFKFKNLRPRNRRRAGGGDLPQGRLGLSGSLNPDGPITMGARLGGAVVFLVVIPGMNQERVDRVDLGRVDDHFFPFGQTFGHFEEVAV